MTEFRSTPPHGPKTWNLRTRSSETVIDKSRAKIFFGIVFFAMGFAWSLRGAILMFSAGGNFILDAVFWSAFSLFTFVIIVINVRRMFNRTGIIITDKGVLYPAGWYELGLIDWNDVTGIRTQKIPIPPYGLLYSKYVVLDTNVPEKYVARITNRYSRWNFSPNIRILGSPLFFTASQLKISHGDLYRELSRKFNNVPNPNSQCQL